MLIRHLLAALFVFAATVPVRALEDCSFGFEIDAQSTAFQALVQGAQERGGFWRPIREAPDDVQEIAHFIGRLDVCLITPDGKPRTIQTANGAIVLRSPHVTSCTAALLPGNRLLTNRHCYFEPSLQRAGFTRVREARVNFGYTSKDFTGSVQTFLVDDRELASDPDVDAMVLQVLGADANDALGGAIPMVMETRATPRRALTMIHHPKGAPQQFSSGTCQVHPAQQELPAKASQLRHSCESAGGSSGSLLLDARTLSVVGLHNQGGLHNRGGYNGGHKIEAVEARLKLGFQTAPAEVSQAVAVAPPPPAPDKSKEALIAALLESDPDQRAAALRSVERRFPGTEAARNAKTALALIPKPQPVAKPAAPVIAVTPAPKPAVKTPAPKRTAVAPAPVAPAAKPDVQDLRTQALGMLLGTLTPAVRREFGIGADQTGAVVHSIVPGSSAAQSGIQPGMVITDAGVLRVTSGDTVLQQAELARRQGRQGLNLRVVGGGRTKNLSLALRDFSEELAEQAALPSGAVVVVKADGTGDFSTLEEAVKRAGYKATIRVFPGRYEAALTLRKEIKIIGIGNRSDIVLTNSEGTVVTLSSKDGARLENLTLESAARYEPAVVFQYGEGAIVSCDIFSMNSTAVSIGSEGEALLFRSTVRSTGGHGLMVSKNFAARIEETSIKGETIGANIGDGAIVEIRNNQIRNNSEAGIWLSSAARGIIAGNNLRGNGTAIFHRGQRNLAMTIESNKM